MAPEWTNRTEKAGDELRMNVDEILRRKKKKDNSDNYYTTMGK